MDSSALITRGILVLCRCDWARHSLGPGRAVSPARPVGSPNPDWGTSDWDAEISILTPLNIWKVDRGGRPRDPQTRLTFQVTSFFWGLLSGHIS
jgi:hypothetical protein